MDYLDIVVRISPRNGQQYGVTVSSTEGEANSTLHLPFALDQLAGTVFGVADTVRDISPAGDAPSAAGPSVREVGERLFDALFRDDIRSVLDRVSAVANERTETGVRIRLAMDLKGDGLAEVASLPWELMRPRDKLPLFTSKRTLLVRSPDILERTDPKPFHRPLRILAMVSRPKGTAALDLDKERDRLKAIWGPVPGVTVELVAPVVADFLKALRDGDFHALHYMGHGGFDPATGRGVLMMEDKSGNPHLVSGEDLGVYLKDELATLRLVFLNACKTATTSARSGIDPFAGIATALIQAGVPAVLAMQFPITDGAAITFSETFYQCVAQGLPVDGAVAEGRKALWSEERSEWATPVLFLRSSAGDLFTPADTPLATAPSVAAGPAPASAAAAAPADDDWEPGSGPRVFVAAADQGVAHLSRQLASALKKEGARVVSSVPPPHEEPEHAAKVRSLAGSADLCVHLLGDEPGEAIDAESPGETGALKTYPLEQLRIGLEAARAQLVIVPDQVDIQSLEDKGYAARVQELVRMPRDNQRFQLVVTGRQQMKDAVLTRLQELEAARRAAEAGAPGEVRTAFVDLHFGDLAQAADLIAYLGRRKITPIMMPSTDTAPAEALALFEANLAKVPLYLVVFGSVTRNWVTNRLGEAFQSVLRHPGAQTRIGVYVAPPVKGTDQLQFPPFCEVAANMSGFDANAVEALIARAAR